MLSLDKWYKISNLEQLYSVVSAWSALNQQCDSSLFCDPRWICNWISIYWQDDWKLEVWAYQQQGQLVALLPTYSQPGTRAGRVLYPLGQGESEEAEVASEFIDLLLAPEFPLMVLHGLAAQLNAEHFYHISWRAILADANILQLARLLRFTQVKPAGLRYQVVGGPLTLQSSQTRRKWRLFEKLQTNGRATFNWIDAQQVETFWPTLTNLHQKRWQAKGKAGAFIAPAFTRFHLGFARKQPDCLRLAILRIDNEIAAIHYYLLDRDNVHFYQAGWHDNFARWSPSAMLHCWVIEQSIGAKYDFMLGDKFSYKADYGTEQVQCYQLNGYSNVIRYTLALLKQLKQRMLQ
ncbi:GNAT family N-acetyltransferase [Rheinheimera baltica]|uniref:GNAT family N-acetyltransferase n=1 Tax=Rheinheimera baltica TaxID=67576 RepID=A0ABT9HUL4_9GAMM|nr:GNAT family N-acetyltransferase [Rheinheimera baltica]MDP5134688.1 GNAT family N-acetyltransferase [Rheinheimera baltica]